MHRKTARSIALVIVVLAGAVFVGTLVHATLYAPSDATYAPAQPAAAFAAGTTTPGMLPTRLLIPKIGVDAAVQQTGLTKDGAMGVPTNFTDVAWYKYGPVPGQWGSAVIDGHVDNGLALPGVFKHLDQVQAGDDIYVRTEGGQTLHFVVRDVKTYPYQQVPSQDVFSKSDAARLTLITCTGTFVPSGRTYDHRLVVYTTLVPS